MLRGSVKSWFRPCAGARAPASAAGSLLARGGRAPVALTRGGGAAGGGCSPQCASRLARPCGIAARRCCPSLRRPACSRVRCLGCSMVLQAGAAPDALQDARQLGPGCCWCGMITRRAQELGSLASAVAIDALICRSRHRFASNNRPVQMRHSRNHSGCSPVTTWVALACRPPLRWLGQAGGGHPPHCLPNSGWEQRVCSRKSVMKPSLPE